MCERIAAERDGINLGDKRLGKRSVQILKLCGSGSAAWRTSRFLTGFLPAISQSKVADSRHVTHSPPSSFMGQPHALPESLM